MGERRLWCFADGGPDGWEAFCPDFDIAVQAETFDEVKASMEEALVSYLDDIRKEDPRTFRRLLYRRAPLYLRVWCALRLLAHAIRSSRDGHDLRAGFDVLCHA